MGAEGQRGVKGHSMAGSCQPVQMRNSPEKRGNPCIWKSDLSVDVMIVETLDQRCNWQCDIIADCTFNIHILLFSRVMAGK